MHQHHFHLRKLLSFLLVFSLMLSILPVWALSESGNTVLAFISDVHNSSSNASANRLSGWIDAIQSSYGHINYIASCGDMGNGGSNITEDQYWSYAKAVMDVIDSKGLTSIYTTGNHEFYNGNFPTTTNALKQKFTVNAEKLSNTYYSLYCLGISSYNNSDYYTDAQVETLRQYLGSVQQNLVFIITHFPLHNYGSRTIGNSGAITDVLNEAAGNGKTIVLLWGHNHTISDTNYDKVKSPGSIITTSDGSKTLQFYYAAAGCMSDSEYTTGSASVKGKGLVITLSADGTDMDFAYHTADGSAFGQLHVDIDEQPTGDIPTPVDAPEAGKLYIIMSDEGYILTTGEGESYTNATTYHYTGLAGKSYTANMSITEDMLWLCGGSNGSYTFQNSGKYLHGSYQSNSSGGKDGALSLSTAMDTWSYTNNALISGNCSKYIYFGNSNQSTVFVNIFSMRSSATSLYFFEYSIPAGILLPEDLQEIQEEAFAGIQATNIIVGENVIRIDARAFADSEVQFIYLPDNVSEIAADAFEGCESLVILLQSDTSYAASYAQSKGITSYVISADQ